MKFLKFKLFIQKKQKYLLIFISIIMFSLGIMVFINEKIKENLTPIYSYNIKRNATYQVLLYDNQFYDTNPLTENLIYPKNAVDKYIINFKYNFKGSKKYNLIYSYNIYATLKGTLNNKEEEKEIWHRDFLLKEETIKNLNTNKLDISEDINIDYKYYDEMAKAYEETFGISMNKTLDVKMDINIKIQGITKKDIEIKDNLNLTIYLKNSITEVEKNYEPKEIQTISSKNQPLKRDKLINYAISFLLIFSSIIIICYLIRIKEKTPKEKYQKELKNILNNYKNLIVEIKTKPNITNLQKFKLGNIEDLIDVAEQNNTNIIYYEKVPSHESSFYVIVNNYVYLYNISTK